MREDTSYGYESALDLDRDLSEPCPMCQRTPTRVQEYMMVASFVIFTRHQRWQSLLCRRCATRMGFSQLVKSAIFGWWGIPWGLMTLQALWINARSLARWSTLPPVVVFWLTLAGLGPPAAALFWFVQHESTEEKARSTGDWVSNDVRKLVERGHVRQAAGDLGTALNLYRKAYAETPNSSVVNHSLAQTHLAMGDPKSARPFAERAVALDPSSVTCATLHASIMVELEGVEATKDMLQQLRGLEPKDASEAMDLAELFDSCQMAEESLGAVEAGLAKDKRSEDLQMKRFLSLMELDRLAEARDQLDALREQVDGHAPYLIVYGDMYEMRTDPERATDSLLRHWTTLGYNEPVMEMVASSAARSGSIEVVRHRIAGWLNEEQTPPEFWAHAKPWFEDQRWAEELDGYLARRPAMTPGLLRLSLYDRVEDRESVLDLATRIQNPDHPLAPYRDMFYYGALAHGVTDTETHEVLVQHAEERPDHALCGLMACKTLSRRQPDRALALLDRVVEMSDPAALPAGLPDMVRVDIDLGRGEPQRALARLDDVDLFQLEPIMTPAMGCVRGIECAFHAGDRKALRSWRARLVQLYDSDDAALSSSRAAALVVRWSEQSARGDELTFTSDVGLWVKRDGQNARLGSSASALGILLAEGEVDREWVEARISPWGQATVDLVAWFKCRAEGRAPERSLESIVGDDSSREFAPMLARRIMESRTVARSESR